MIVLNIYLFLEEWIHSTFLLMGVECQGIVCLPPHQIQNWGQDFLAPGIHVVHVNLRDGLQKLSMD